jgi:hypothetical protein
MAGWQHKASDAIDGLALVITVFDKEQRWLMMEMHLEIQLLFSVFVLSVCVARYIDPICM